jgi:hypothetical protein
LYKKSSAISANSYRAKPQGRNQALPSAASPFRRFVLSGVHAGASHL